MVRAWESLHFATLELVRSAPIKQRLISAYRRHLSLIPTDQLPGEIQESFRHLMSSLHGVQPQRGEDAVAASVRKMSNQEADECASLIVEIFGLMCRPQLVPARSGGAVVQLHSVESPAADFEVAGLIASN
ncbi:MAG: hypothetical protein WB440_13130 [Steroidobacteraceae bacterium]|jgi:hypothetical protein